MGGVDKFFRQDRIIRPQHMTRVYDDGTRMVAEELLRSTIVGCVDGQCVEDSPQKMLSLNMGGLEVGSSPCI